MRVRAYYFRAHTYTIVPRHVREDMAWMADHGTDDVVIGVLEQDLDAARANYDIIAREAERVGMNLYATPSRWGNLVAGCPKVPSIFCATHPECAAMDRDGKPYYGFLGALASVHHPLVVERFHQLMEKTVTYWPVAGIIWDELKGLHVMDHCEYARSGLGVRVDDREAQLESHISFFGELNRLGKRLKPELTTGCFIYSFVEEGLREAVAKMECLDEFGCDGRPWPLVENKHKDSESAKSLLDHGGLFLATAQKHGVRSLALIENHALQADMHDVMERHLPSVFQQGWGSLMYYYYPRDVEEPDEAMERLGRALLNARGVAN